MAFRVNTNVAAMNTLRYLGNTNSSLQTSMQRLSSGMRINSGADDPAGLQISEGFRAQLSGIDQALRNTSDASNYAKTAEGALSEMNTLLQDARSLALANSNDATLTADQKQANQNQLNSILTSINRISTDTQYGTKKLLDGSAGVTATLTDTSKVAGLSIAGNLGGTALTADSTLSVQVTTAAAQANLAGKTITSLATAVVTPGSFSINGVAFSITTQQNFGQVIDSINAQSSQTGVTASINGTAIKFTANKYGAAGNNIQIVDTGGVVLSAAGTSNLASGADAVATVTAGSVSATFTGGTAAYGDDGLTLRDTSGNKFALTAGFAKATGGSATTIGQVKAGSANFQIGANANQSASVSISNMSAASLGLSGTSADIMTTANVSTTLAAIDSAITSVSKSRGDLGNFMRNVLDSNTRSLGVAKENLQAADSTIRDTDMASEMSKYTQTQILQQAGMSMLAQANSGASSILSLLRG